MNAEEIKNENRKIAISAVIFVFLMVVIMHAALICMLRHDYAQSGRILRDQVINTFYMPNIGADQPNMMSSPNYQNFVNQTANFIKNYPAAIINIYDQDAKKVLSTSQEELSVHKDHKIMDYIAEFFIDKSEGKAISSNDGFNQVIWSADFKGQKDQAFMRVVEPMYAGKNKVGTIEIMYVFSRHLEDLDNTRLFCLMLSVIIIFGYFFLVQRSFHNNL